LNTLESIQSILKNLAKEERGRFITSYTESGNKLRYKDRVVLLLEILNKTTIDSQIIKIPWAKKLRGQKSDRAFQNAQRKLLDDILHYLVTQNPYCQNHPYEKEMILADKCVQLGQFDEAYNRFKKILNLLQAQNSLYWQGIVLRKIHKITSKLTNVNEATEKELETFANLEKTVAEQIIPDTEVYHFQLKLGKRITEGWVIRTTKDRKEFIEWFNSKILSIDDTNLTITPFAYITKAKTAAYRILLEYEKAFQTQLTLVRKLDSNIDQLKVQKPDLLFSEYLDLADLSYRTGRITFAEEQLSRVEACLPFINDNNEYRTASILNIRCNIAYRYKHLDELSIQASLLSDTYKNLFATAPALHVPIIIGTLLKSFLKLENYKLIEYWYDRIKHSTDEVRKNNIFLIHIIYACSAYSTLKPQFNFNKMEIDSEFKSTILNVNSYISQKNQDLYFEKLIVKKFLYLADSKEREKHITIFSGLLAELGKLPFEGYIYQEQIYEIFDIRNWVIEQITRLKKVSADN